MYVGSRSTARREGDEYVWNGEKMWDLWPTSPTNFLFFCWTDRRETKAPAIKRDRAS